MPWTIRYGKLGWGCVSMRVSGMGSQQATTSCGGPRRQHGILLADLAEGFGGEHRIDGTGDRSYVLSEEDGKARRALACAYLIPADGQRLPLLT